MLSVHSTEFDYAVSDAHLWKMQGLKKSAKKQGVGYSCNVGYLTKMISSSIIYFLA